MTDPELGLKQRPLRNTACWVLPLTCSAGFLPQCRAICLEMTLPTAHRACFCHGTSHACWTRLLSNKRLCVEQGKGQSRAKKQKVDKQIGFPQNFSRRLQALLYNIDWLYLQGYSHALSPQSRQSPSCSAGPLCSTTLSHCTLAARYSRGGPHVSSFKTCAKPQSFWHFLEFTNPVSHLSWTRSCVSICLPCWYPLLRDGIAHSAQGLHILLWCSCPLRASWRNSTTAPTSSMSLDDESLKYSINKW